MIAIAAPWNALPRKPKVIDTTQKAYVEAVRDFLKTKGIQQPKVKIESILRADLDGDGEEEVLISATNYFSKDNHLPMRSPAGSYSMVLLRRMVAGKVETQLVEGEFHPKAYVRKGDSFDAPNAYKVIATLDLDGDGKMESSSARVITKEKRLRFTVATRKRLRLYFRWLAVPDSACFPSWISAP